MENQTRFDLTTALENWRRELSAQPPLTSDNRRELENHLRDVLAELKARGLSDEESFWLARRRVGQPPQLASEFVKVDPAKVWRDRMFWMAFGTISFSQITMISSYLERITLFRWNLTLDVFYQQYWEILAGLPVFITIYALTRNQNGLVQRLTRVFQSRLRLSIVLVLMAGLCTLTQMHNFPGNYQPVFTWGTWFLFTLGYLKFCLVPLVFIVWFLPTPKRRLAELA